MDGKKLIYADDLLSSLRDDETIDGAHFKRVKQHINAAPAVDALAHGKWAIIDENCCVCSVCHNMRSKDGRRE